MLTSSQSYGIGAVLALGVIGEAKKGEANAEPSQQPPKANKFEMK